MRRPPARKEVRVKGSKHILPGVLLLLATVVSAATPFSEYLSRVGQAARMTKLQADKLDSRAAPDQDTREQINTTISRVREMLPAVEDIQFDQEVIHVDNSWLHQPVIQAVTADSKEATPDDQREGRPEKDLVIMAERLGALERRLKAAPDAAEKSAAERERLQRILAQAEYQDELHRESEVQKWLRKIWSRIVELLLRIFGGGGARAQPGGSSLNLFRLLLLAAIVSAVVFGIVRLLRRFNQRAPVKEEPEMREVLGELIAEGASSEDLFRNAAELARQGNCRLAVRRAYVALLYELELRGKLQLHRAKTNRDYLREVSSDKYIYPPVEYMTTTFERAWYGEAETQLEDFANFVERYREVVTVR